MLLSPRYTGEAPRPPGPRKVSYSDFEAICAQLRAKEVPTTSTTTTTTTPTTTTICAQLKAKEVASTHDLSSNFLKLNR